MLDYHREILIEAFVIYTLGAVGGRGMYWLLWERVSPAQQFRNLRRRAKQLPQ